MSAASIEKGEELAKQYCQGCHMLPDPALLDAKRWETGVLPNMGPRLGIFEHLYTSYPNSKNDPALDSNFYPAHPLLRPEEWQCIIDYFTATSPDSLPAQKRNKNIQNRLSLFEAQAPVHRAAAPMVTMVKIDTAFATHQLMLYNMAQGGLYFYDAQLNIKDSVPTSGAIVDAEWQTDALRLCNIGNINPNNAKLGKAQWAFQTPLQRWRLDTAAIIGNLGRPVQITAFDADGNRDQDYLVCEFGYLTGSLSWYEHKDDKSFERHVLRPQPGAIKAYVNDYNKDGLPDIWVLFAQGEEGVFLYTNKGKGRFSGRQVLRFPPLYGSSYFELADFNQDGFADIVYTCGDNADYSMSQKPYHGVYIFLNDGKNNFRQKFFYPINGCFKALARDFDGDGDLDMATISFFADYARQPEEGFVYFENLGNFNFSPSSLPEGRQGRWLTMDAGDLDGDGRTDLVLGNFSAGPAIIKSTTDWKQGPPFLFLKNRGKAPKK